MTTLMQGKTATRTSRNEPANLSGQYLEEGAALAEIVARRDGARSAGRGDESAPATRTRSERFDVIVIGAGHSGLSAGYHLQQKGVSFVILDANPRIGDVWRRRWDSLHLFSPAQFDSLDGWAFPAPGKSFPGKDAMADYLEAYAARFALPVRSGIRVERLSRQDGIFVAESGARRFEAAQVIIAMSPYQKAKVPEFAGTLDADIVQFHSIDYRSPDQLRDGSVLLVGAGNSASEIARELAPGRTVIMAGRHPGHVPFRPEGFLGRHLLVRLLFRGVFHRILTVDTPFGRRARKKAEHATIPLIRVKPKDLAAAGVTRVARITGIRDGRPMTEDGKVLDVANVVWCTGFDPDLAWLDVPTFDAEGWPEHDRGVAREPGLYFLGFGFVYAFSSMMIHGVGRDAARIAGQVAARVRQPAAD